MTLFIIFICAICAGMAYRYNTAYIEAEAAQKRAKEEAKPQTLEERVMAKIDAVTREVEQRKAEEEQRKAEEATEELLRLRNRKVERFEFVIGTAEEEIDSAMVRRDKLISLYDCAMEELEGVTPNGKEWQKIQKSLLTYENQLNTVEKRIRKAQFTRKQALAELEEIA